MVDFSLNSWKKVSDMPRTSSLMSSWLVAFTCATERGTGKGQASGAGAAASRGTLLSRGEGGAKQPRPGVGVLLHARAARELQRTRTA